MSKSDLLRRVRDALDVSVAEIDSPTLLRLQAARRGALELLERDTPRLPSRWLPAMAFAATMAITVGVWHQMLLPPLPVAGDPVETFAAQDADLLENLEFVAWMEADDDDNARG